MVTGNQCNNTQATTVIYIIIRRFQYCSQSLWLSFSDVCQSMLQSHVGLHVGIGLEKFWLVVWLHIDKKYFNQQDSPHLLAEDIIITKWYWSSVRTFLNWALWVAINQSFVLSLIWSWLCGPPTVCLVSFLFSCSYLLYVIKPHDALSSYSLFPFNHPFQNLCHQPPTGPCQNVPCKLKTFSLQSSS